MGSVSSSFTTIGLTASPSDPQNVSVIVVTESALKKLQGQAEQVAPSNDPSQSEHSGSTLDNEEVDRINAFWQRRLYMYSNQNKLLEEKLQMIDKIDLPGVNVALGGKAIDSDEMSSQSICDAKQLEQCYHENLKQPLKCHMEVRKFLRKINEST